MKSYVKGVITGILIGAVVSAISAVAENIDVLFNEVRINVKGVDAIQQGENIDLGEGESTPASILYNGTTYLPMRKLGELSGQQVYWNGDSKTVSMTGKQKDVNVVAEKPDKNGNVWKYYTFKDNENSYLGVKDEARGYERVYKMLNDNVKVAYDALYFVRADYPDRWSSVAPIKMMFDSDTSSQDGMIMKAVNDENGYEDTVGSVSGDIYGVCFEGDYMFVCGQSPGNGAHAFIMAYNRSNRHYNIYFDEKWWTRASDISAETDGDEIILNFVYGTTGPSFNCEMTYNKITHTFGEMETIDKE